MLRFFFAFLLTLSLSGCRVTDLQHYDRQNTITWYEVINQYQRRIDVVANIISAVQHHPVSSEPQTLAALQHAKQQARQADIALQEAPDNPEAIARWQQAQTDLSQALSQTLALTKNAHVLKDDAIFLRQMAQLEATENRIMAARLLYLTALKNYNLSTRGFPNEIVARFMGYPLRNNRLPLSIRENLHFSQIDFS